MTSTPTSAAGSAAVFVLHSGYAGLDGDDERVSGMVTDPLACGQAALAASRELLLSFADVIIPGHGQPFRPGAAA